MYRCQLCGIEHDFDICPYCGTVRQGSPATLRLNEDAADLIAAEDEPMKLTEAASGRIRKSSREGHRPPPAPKNQPTLLRDVSPVFTPDPDFTMPNEQEDIIGQAEKADIYSDDMQDSTPAESFSEFPAAEEAAPPPDEEEIITQNKETSEKPLNLDDDNISAYFAAAAARLASGEAKTQNPKPNAKHSKAAKPPAAHKIEKTATEADDAVLLDDDSDLFAFTDTGKIEPLPAAVQADEQPKKPLVRITKTPHTSEFSDYDRLLNEENNAPSEQAADTPQPAAQGKHRFAHSEEVQKPALLPYWKKFFGCVFTGRLTEAMELSACDGVFYSWIFGIASVISGVFLGLTEVRLADANSLTSVPFAIGGGVILQLEVLFVLTLIIQLLMLLTNTNKGAAAAFGLACVSSLPSFIFSLLSLGTAWLYQPLALPLLICSAVFTAINLHAAAKALGIFEKKSGFILFCAMLTLYIISASVMTSSIF